MKRRKRKKKLIEFDNFIKNNTFIIGASGTRKTHSVVIPTILVADASYIVFDPYKEIRLSTEEKLKNVGYKIKVLDLLKNGFVVDTVSKVLNPTGSTLSEDAIDFNCFYKKKQFCIFMLIITNQKTM